MSDLLKTNINWNYLLYVNSMKDTNCYFVYKKKMFNLCYNVKKSERV